MGLECGRYTLYLKKDGIKFNVKRKEDVYNSKTRKYLGRNQRLSNLATSRCVNVNSHHSPASPIKLTSIHLQVAKFEKHGFNWKNLIIWSLVPLLAKCMFCPAAIVLPRVFFPLPPWIYAWVSSVDNSKVKNKDVINTFPPETRLLVRAAIAALQKQNCK